MRARLRTLATSALLAGVLATPAEAEPVGPVFSLATPGEGAYCDLAFDTTGRALGVNPTRVVTVREASAGGVPP